MLEVVIKDGELFDSSTETFIPVKEQTIQLEHSLISLSKWESKHCKPFLVKDQKSDEELLDYVRCMTITSKVDQNVYLLIDSETMAKINSYINAKMTATTFLKERGRMSNREIVTSEIIYYWMIALNIPFECQKWHLNRLLVLIDVCNRKNQPEKKMSQKEILAQNRALNEARKARLGTEG